MGTVIHHGPPSAVKNSCPHSFISGLGLLDGGDVAACYCYIRLRVCAAVVAIESEHWHSVSPLTLLLFRKEHNRRTVLAPIRFRRLGPELARGHDSNDLKVDQVNPPTGPQGEQFWMRCFHNLEHRSFAEKQFSPTPCLEQPGPWGTSPSAFRSFRNFFTAKGPIMQLLGTSVLAHKANRRYVR